MDAVRRAGSVELRFDLPGVDASTIDLTVERDVLSVRAERGWTPEESDEVLAHERPQGTWSRQILLGESLDTERLDASLEAGVLVVRIPVAEQAKARRVEVRGGESATQSEAIDVGSGSSSE
jgi:HSP20 family protein